MTGVGPFVVGHRTHSAAIGAGYAAAGVTYFELDVRVVAGRVIVTHYRPVRWSGGVIERDNARLRRQASPGPDATVEEVLVGLPAQARIVFDPKDREPERRVRLVELLADKVECPGRHVVSTRNRRDLEMFAEAGFRTWWTLDTPTQIRQAAARTLPADGVTVRHRSLNAESVRRLHTVTDTVVAWTARSVSRARELVAIGVDGITTHDIGVMTAVRDDAGAPRRGL